MVRVVFVAVATAAAWGLFTREDPMASAAAQASFDAHNRCIDSCNGQPAADVEWDSPRVAAGVLIVGLYAIRWALLERWRPWWVSGGEGSSTGSVERP